MAPHKTIPWSVSEVTQFLMLVSDEKIQLELDGTRNEKVYRELAQQMASYGYERTFRQCREKLKKMKSDYRAIKENISNRKGWRWFPHMDAIYGHRDARRARDDGGFLEVVIEDDLSPTLVEAPSPKSVSAPPPEATPTPSQPSEVESEEEDNVSMVAQSTPKRRRKGTRESELVAVLRQIHSADLRHHQVEEAQQERVIRLQELQFQQRSEHFQLALEEMRLAREMEESLRREQLAATNAFNQAFLGMVGKLVERSSQQ
ncbi:zinc finger and SCAN domain-containing protein 20-like [Dunckerocampus dactyliophorus]|uniref:zinc finger and SCAN domain-containing protein 20-like n=1 Tax=Dunckerocampus dactyliophorus TaxID=161453 RepID=UPI00240767B1|nr:zinc finger and SCAN domain-containing protein 20-like [Dunckerocampus dactyliophorus]